MQLSDQQTLPVARELVWAALNDPELLREAIAGCESITPRADDPGAYDVALMAVVGPVKARFTGTLRITDPVPPASYALQFEAKAAAGHGKGHATVRLEATAPAETRLSYDVQASVGGKLAQVGSRLVDMAAQKMAADFFEKLRTLLLARHGVAEAPAAAAARGGWLARLAAWLRRMFGGQGGGGGTPA